uniref:Uncharacterized protein n=1 Tax=Siphoviridae sp. ctnpt50 TaxID=2827941 RepID=A0A8S5SDH6_9CAUD|nr:MAG TPA: hypothetical protein [Siphoviridae sp. ctnpt50]
MGGSGTMVRPVLQKFGIDNFRKEKILKWQLKKH